MSTIPDERDRARGAPDPAGTDDFAQPIDPDTDPSEFARTTPEH